MIAAEFLATFEEFPPRQKPQSFQIVEKMDLRAGVGGSSHATPVTHSVYGSVLVTCGSR